MNLDRLIRWYPKQWRARYGEELVALIEDELDGRRPTLAIRCSTAWGGLRERGHQSGLVGASSSPSRRMRAGSLLVLWSWAAFTLAGASFYKLSEHFAASMPVASRATPQRALDIVTVLGITGIALVVAGAAATVPTFARLMKDRGWTHILRAFIWASAVSLTLVAGSVPLLLWAHHLTGPQRNGGNAWYSAAFIGWALLIAATLFAWTRFAAVAARRVTLSRALLRFEAGLATALTAVMLAIAVSTAVWWQSVGANAPWFLQGTKVGVAASAVNVHIVATIALMVGAGVVAAFGTARSLQFWRMVGPGTSID